MKLMLPLILCGLINFVVKESAFAEFYYPLNNKKIVNLNSKSDPLYINQLIAQDMSFILQHPSFIKYTKTEGPSIFLGVEFKYSLKCSMTNRYELSYTNYNNVEYRQENCRLMLQVGDCHSSKREISVLTNSCNTKQLDRYKNSLLAWQVYKSKINNTYLYTSTFSSEVGHEIINKNQIIEGEVVTREHQYTDMNGVVQEQWLETGSEVGSHLDEGFPVLTLDEIYLKCFTEVLSDKNKNFVITFKTDENNILTNCNKRNKNCAGDCSRGYNLKLTSDINL